MNNQEITRTEALMRVIRTKISTRALSANDRLPSVRRFAKIMGVSPTTVVEAYDRLEAEGLIYAKKNSGFYVRAANDQFVGFAKIETLSERNIDPLWISRQALDAEASVLKPGCGWLPAEWMPHEALRKGLRSLGRAGDAILSDYGDTRGSVNLRRYLLNGFADENITAGMDQIILTGSGTQAIDLICRLLLQPGDSVLVDDPCYFNFHALLRVHQAKIIGIPFTHNGPDLEKFEQALKDEKPRLYITNSALHNPTGATISPQTAHRLLSLATAHGLTIIEDDIFADFEPTAAPRLAVMDGLNNVIRIGSFSKTLSASVRCGYIAAREEWIERLIDLQVATSFGGPSPVTTELISHVLVGGGYRKHMDQIRQRLSQAREEVAEQLALLGIVPWVVPRGGFYLWCELPDNLDSAMIARHCAKENIILAPGNSFSVTQSASSFLRFNVAQMRDARIYKALLSAMGG